MNVTVLANTVKNKIYENENSFVIISYPEYHAEFTNPNYQCKSECGHVEMVLAGHVSCMHVVCLVSYESKQPQSGNSTLHRGDPPPRTVEFLVI